MTIRSRVIELFRSMSSPTPLTATTIRDVLSEATPVLLSSLSSELNRMYHDDLLHRVDAYGPRGGYGYTLTMKGRMA